jgi:hypothetical protein
VPGVAGQFEWVGLDVVASQRAARGDVGGVRVETRPFTSVLDLIEQGAQLAQVPHEFGQDRPGGAMIADRIEYGGCAVTDASARGSWRDEVPAEVQHGSGKRHLLVEGHGLSITMPIRSRAADFAMQARPGSLSDHRQEAEHLEADECRPGRWRVPVGPRARRRLRRAVALLQ